MPATITRRATRLGALLLLVATVVSLGACQVTSVVTGPREWKTEAQLTDGTKTSIVVRDESGRLSNVEINPAGVTANEISNPPDQPNVVLVPWAGGACDVNTVITFTSSGQGLAGTIKVTTSGQVCNMMAIQQVLRLTSNAPLPADQVTLNPAP